MDYTLTVFSFVPFHNVMVFEQPDNDRLISTWMCTRLLTIRSLRDIQQICISDRHISSILLMLDTRIMALSLIHIVDRLKPMIEDSSWSPLLDLQLYQSWKIIKWIEKQKNKNKSKSIFISIAFRIVRCFYAILLYHRIWYRKLCMNSAMFAEKLFVSSLIYWSNNQMSPIRQWDSSSHNEIVKQLLCHQMTEEKEDE